jgi:ankyrin repeat protein
MQMQKLEWSHPNIIKKFIQSKGIQPNAMDAFYDTALLRAIRIHNIELVKFILQHGGDATKANRDGYTPVHVAALNGEPEIVRLLMKYGGSFWSELHEETFWGNLSKTTNSDPTTLSYHKLIRQLMA